MRKTSQDAGDSSSIKSGIENETNKSGIIKSKKNSLKRKGQHFSHESDDGVIEPLLNKDKAKSELPNQSAKFNILSKTKTDTASEKSDKDKLIQDDSIQTSSSRKPAVKDSITIKTTSSLDENTIKKTVVTGPIHNHMNTNVFSNHETLKALITTKSQILVEIDTSKPNVYSPNPLIFTTAKIHTDGKTKQMEPVHVTPVPILSTIEVSFGKGANITSNGEPSGPLISNVNTVYSNISKSNLTISQSENKSKTIMTTANTVIKSTNNTNNVWNSNAVTSSNEMGDINVSTSNGVLSKITPNVYPGKLKSPSDNINKVPKQEISQDNRSHPETSVYQITNPSEKTKTVNLNETIKPVPVKLATTSDAPTNLLNRTLTDIATKRDDVFKFSDNKVDLNKSFGSSTVQEGKGSEIVKSPNILTNKNECTNENSTMISRNSIGGKQLQRQKTAIDTDDSISSSKPTTTQAKSLKETNKTSNEKSGIAQNIINTTSASTAVALNTSVKKTMAINTKKPDTSVVSTQPTSSITTKSVNKASSKISNPSNTQSIATNSTTATTSVNFVAKNVSKSSGSQTQNAANSKTNTTTQLVNSSIPPSNTSITNAITSIASPTISKSILNIEKSSSTATKNSPEAPIVKHIDPMTAKKHDMMTAKKTDTATAKKSGKTTAKKTDMATVNKPDKSIPKIHETSAIKKADTTTAKKTDATTLKKLDTTTAKKSDTVTVKTPDTTKAKIPDTTTVKKTDTSTAKTHDMTTVKNPIINAPKIHETTTVKKHDTATAKMADTTAVKKPDTSTTPSSKTLQGSSKTPPAKVCDSSSVITKSNLSNKNSEPKPNESSQGR